MRTLNLGILAHVDAGKTSLTERLLHRAGVVDEIGSVDAGSTRTDFLALERRRGITIKSAVVSFAVGDVTVNLLDTPGHPDFIAEVERVLSVLDGAVLVVSAVEGVQAQTRVLMRVLRRLCIPTLVFVNKIDRAGAAERATLDAVAARLTPALVPMGTVDRIGTRDAAVRPYARPPVEAVVERDDALLAAYVEGRPLPDLRAALAAQTARVVTHPVFFGSAITGAGIGPLVAGITDLLPATAGDPTGPLSATVFKVDRGPAGEKVAYARVFSGAVRVRDRLPAGRVTSVEVFDQGAAVPADQVPAGRIGRLGGLAGVRIGDALGRPRPGAAHHFAPPTLETVVEPARPADRGPLQVALTQLAEQDPLIDLRRDDRGRTSVSLYGEVQKEVIQATLAEEYGLAVTFRATSTIHVERPAGTGAAYELMGGPGNPFLATVGLRVEPAPAGAGVDLRLAVELGSMPYAFFAAVRDTVRRTLREGRHGWEVVDCVVTMTHSGYSSLSSTGGDFRGLTPLVLMAALARAGTVVHEPVSRFGLEIPADTLGAVSPVLSRLRGTPDATAVTGPVCRLRGRLPAARVHDLERALPGLTRGEGVLETAFDSWEPVRGTPPARPRTGPDPLDRKAYLLGVGRAL